MSQNWTKEMKRAVNAIDRNTRGLAKLVSATFYVAESGAEFFELENAKFQLVNERRRLRASLEAELAKQAGWQQHKS